MENPIEKMENFESIHQEKKKDGKFRIPKHLRSGH
jgi:hypothetical protein